LDSHNIDMELLRRVGVARSAISALEGDVAGLAEALEHMLERSADLAPLTDFLTWLLDAVRGAPSEELTSSSRFATALVASLETMETYVFSAGEPGVQDALEQARSAMDLAVDWSHDAVQSVQDGDGATPEGPSLDDVAVFMVEMDPEGKADAVRLHELVDEAKDRYADDPQVVEAIVVLSEILAEVTAPARVAKSKRKAAIERVGALLEDVLDAIEHADLGFAPEGAVAPAAAEPEMSLPESSGPETAVSDVASTVGVDSPTAKAEPPDLDFPDDEPLPDSADMDLLGDFLIEAGEHLEGAEAALLTLEQDPSDDESVNVVFRSFHTIKGVAAFMELHRIANLAHHAETLLTKVRDKVLVCSGPVADIALQSIDMLKELFSRVDAALQGGPVRLPQGYRELFGTLADPGLVAELAKGATNLVPVAVKQSNEQVGEATASSGTTISADSSVRVRTDRLDSLVDMVGELVIAHSTIVQDPLVLEDRGALSKKVDHTAKILRELQDLSTALRMVPLRPAFNKVSRVVRDLSRKTGKPVNFVTEGEDTEIDRTMVDIIGDPLVHMVRNSLDHGLEDPEERKRLGKPPKGLLRISAFQAGGNVVIEVKDDGRGLDRDKILAKAIKSGVVDSDRGMSDQDIYDLIFMPGFSTADKVTEVSGRGVGMDVVRRNVESLRGRATIKSEPGVGSVFTLSVPLTLAITDGIVIKVGQERYIVPSVKIHMSLQPTPEQVSTVAGGGQVLLWHGNVLPIVRLHEAFGVSGAIEEITKAILVIVGEGKDRAALLVDTLEDQQQFVQKALSGLVTECPGIAGAAIMGTGSVGLILDPEAIVAAARDDAGEDWSARTYAQVA
jgi:two-component system, chemotaxis family, sensor kinase CheA